MILLIIFAFLAGLVTILSPCILPILPIVLSGSLTGGKKRPVGIMVGFIASFTFFTLFLSVLVKFLGLSPDTLRLVAIAIVLLFGVSLILPKFQIWMEGLFSKLAGLAPKNTQDSGFVGGVVVGLSLGLVWAPCVGPILASIIALAASGSVSASAIPITLAYSTGTSIPMLAITYGGRQLLQKTPWLISNSGGIQKAFGVLMILTAMALYFNIDRIFQSYVLTVFPNYGTGLTQLEDNPLVKAQLEKIFKKPVDSSKTGKPMYDLVPSDLGAAPEFIAGGQWFNPPAGGPPTIASLRGKVVLIDFWTYTCINCIRTLPYTKAWWAKYKDKGLVIVGVHTPEFEFEKEAKNVEKAIRDFGITYPVMQDNAYATWNAYNNQYWPAEYFIDKNGKIRKTHFGEGNYDESEAFIQKLLEETGAQITEKPNNPTYIIRANSPESYLGYSRIQYVASPEQIAPDKEQTYSIPANLDLNTFAYGGTWNVGAERAMPKKGATLAFHFDAGSVFLVMRPKTEGVTGKVRVLVDDKPVTAEVAGVDVVDGVVTVDADRLYTLLKFLTTEDHIIKLEFLDDNLELYAFTFG